MKRRTLAAVAIAAAVMFTGVTPATALEDPVDIRAELDLPGVGGAVGPKVFLVEGVTAGPGPELTGADLAENPSDWYGDIVVDIDPDAQTITVSADTVADYHLVVVRITSSEFTEMALVSSNFAQSEDGSELAIDLDADGVTFTWSVTPDVVDGFFYTDGVAVFSYAQAAEEDEDDDSAAPADPVVAEPTFTG